MTLAGIRMRVVGRDATLMRGRDGTDTSYETDTLSFGAGESFDAIFTAPPHTAGRARHVRALQPRVHPRSTTSRPAAAAASGPRCASTRRAPWPPSIPQRPGIRPHERGTTMRVPRFHAPARVGWPLLVSPLLVGRRCSLCDPVPRPRRRAANRIGIVCTTARGPNPTFTLTTRAGYINLPDGNTAYMWGYSEGRHAVPAPGPGPVREPGRHGHRDPAQLVRRTPSAGGLDHLPWPGERAGQRRAVPAAVRRRAAR